MFDKTPTGLRLNGADRLASSNPSPAEPYMQVERLLKRKRVVLAVCTQWNRRSLSKPARQVLQSLSAAAFRCPVL